MGSVLIGIGFLVGGINLFVTAGYFFSNDQAFLGVVMLLVPPAEFVLPWVANTTLGVLSLVSIILPLAGAALSKGDRQMGLTRQVVLRRTLFLVVTNIVIVNGISVDSAQAISLRTSDTSLIKTACKEWSRTPSQPKTSAELTKWLGAAQTATKRALVPATAAAKKNSKWNAFVGNLVILQANMDSLQRKRQFADAKLWDYAVIYLKSTCTRILK
jgi:hypothetical protein